MARYLVTGGAGFIGSHIVDALLAQGHSVRVIDNLSTGKKENLEHVKDRIELVVGDIRDRKVVESAVCGTEYIIHQAAIPSVPRSFKNPIETLSANTDGTLQLLEAAKKNNIRCFVYASSSSTYGKASPYGISKLLGEQYCVLYSRLYNLNTVCLRYFNVFGPRQNPNSQYAAVVPKFVNALRNGNSPTINGDGKQSRDFTFVRNVVLANLTIRTQGVYDIGCGKSTTVNKLFKLISDILRSKTQPQYGPSRPGDIRFSCAKINKTVFQPKVNLLEGLKLTINA